MAFGSKYTSPATNTDGSGINIDASSTDAVAQTSSTPFINAYPWTVGGGWGTKYSAPGVLPPAAGNSAHGVRFSPAGTDVVASFGNSSPFIRAWPFTSGGGFGVAYANPATLPAKGNALDFSPSGTAIAVTMSAITPFIHVYPWTTGVGFGAKYANPGVAAPVAATTTLGAPEFTPDDAKLIYTYNGTSSNRCISGYPWSTAGGFGTKYTDPALAVATSGSTGLSIHPTSEFVVTRCADSSHTYVGAWELNAGGFGSALAEGITNAGSYAGALDFSSDGRTLFFTHVGASGPSAHPWSIVTGFSGVPYDVGGSNTPADVVCRSVSDPTYDYVVITSQANSTGGVGMWGFTNPTAPLPAADYPCLVGNPVIWGATTDINGTVFQFSKRPLRDPATYYGGYKAPRLLEMGPIRRAASDFLTGTWEAQTAWMRLADTDYTFRNLGYQPSLIAREAWLYLLSENTRLAKGNPTLLFHGPIYNDPFSEDFTYTINVNDYVGSNYNLFKDDKMIPQRTVGTDDFPNRPAQSEGLGVPIIGGVVSETDGAIKAYSVGLLTVAAVNYAVAMVCGHACAGGIINAYDDTGAALAWGTDAFAPGKASWATIQPGGQLYYDINGNRYTLIFLLASSAIGTAFLDGTASIYVNTNGMEPTGAGTGAVIERLFELRKYLMVQWYTQSYRAGAWLTGAEFEFYPGMGVGYPVVDEVSFDTAHTFSVLGMTGGYKGAFVIGAGGRRQSIRQRLANDNVSSSSWMGLNAKNQIFVYLLDRTNATFLGSQRTLTDRRDILKTPKFRLEPKMDWFFNDLGYQYAANYREDGRGDWNGHNIQGNAPSKIKYDEVTHRLTYDLVRDDETADTVAGMQLIICGPDPPRIATWTQSLCGMGQDILTGWPMTHYQGRGSVGWNQNPVLILSQTFNPSDCRTTFTGLDVEGILLGFD